MYVYTLCCSCSKLTPGFMLMDHSWLNIGDHIQCETGNFSAVLSLQILFVLFFQLFHTILLFQSTSFIEIQIFEMPSFSVHALIWGFSTPHSACLRQYNTYLVSNIYPSCGIEGKKDIHTCYFFFKYFFSNIFLLPLKKIIRG